MATVLFKKNLPLAQLPLRASAESACHDLYAAKVEHDAVNNQLIVDIGISTSFAHGYCLLVFGRSGFARDHGIRLSNGVAVIDADYRGPLKVLLRSDMLTLKEMAQIIKPGTRVAQAMIVPVPFTDWVEVDALDQTARGEGGFGSTGTR